MRPKTPSVGTGRQTKVYSVPSPRLTYQDVPSLSSPLALPLSLSLFPIRPSTPLQPRLPFSIPPISPSIFGTFLPPPLHPRTSQSLGFLLSNPPHNRPSLCSLFSLSLPPFLCLVFGHRITRLSTPCPSPLTPETWCLGTRDHCTDSFVRIEQEE